MYERRGGDQNGDDMRGNDGCRCSNEAKEASPWIIRDQYLPQNQINIRLEGPELGGPSR